MVSRRLATWVVLLMGGCARPREYVVTDIGEPWRDARISADSGRALARLSEDASVRSVVPLDEFPAVRPGMTTDMARASLGEPSQTRRENDATVYFYSGRAGDVEIVERNTFGGRYPTPATASLVRSARSAKGADRVAGCVALTAAAIGRGTGGAGDSRGFEPQG